MKNIRIKFPKFRLKTYIFVVFLFVSIVPLLISNIINYNRNRTEARDAAFMARDQFMSLASLELNDIVEQVEKIYLRLAVDNELAQKLEHWPDDQLGVFQNMREIENNILGPYLALYPYIDNLIIYPGNTQYAVAAGSAGYAVTEDYEKFSFYREAVENPQRSFWEGPHEYEGNYYGYSMHDAVSFLQAVKSGNNTFVIEIQIDNAALDEKIAASQDGYHSRIALLDTNDEIVSVNQKDEFREENYINKTVILDNNWKLLYSIPKDELRETARIQMQTMVGITAVYIILAAALSVLTSVLVSRPIRKVISRMKVPIDENSGEVKTFSYIKEIAYLAESYENMRIRTRNLIDDLIEEQRKKQAAEMRVLQSQINPHFLYNSLNLIRCTAALNGQKDIEKMSQAIVQLLEFSINSQECVKISEEIEITRQYINLQECRHNKKMNINIQVQEGIGRNLMLKMTIIPLVENAIIHAYNGGEADVHIDVSLSCIEKKLIIEVQDYGSGMTEKRINEIFEKTEGKFNRIGVKNIIERVQLYFGEEYHLSIYSKEGEGTLVRVEHPVLSEKDWEGIRSKSHEKNSDS